MSANGSARVTLKGLIAEGSSRTFDGALSRNGAPAPQEAAGSEGNRLAALPTLWMRREPRTNVSAALRFRVNGGARGVDGVTSERIEAEGLESRLERLDEDLDAKEVDRPRRRA